MFNFAGFYIKNIEIIIEKLINFKEKRKNYYYNFKRRYVLITI